jgi:hypothetical protein
MHTLLRKTVTADKQRPGKFRWSIHSDTGQIVTAGGFISLDAAQKDLISALRSLVTEDWISG